MKRTRATAQVKARHVFTFAVAALGLVAGCGDSGSSDECAKVVDAYAMSWQRCMRTSYDDAKKTWSDAFMCDSAKGWNSSNVDACVNALNMLDCGSVKNNVSPSPCGEVLPK
jgi:hypothetical protein